MNLPMRIVAAWAVGWAVYMVAMAMTSYDGPLSLLFQPFIGALVSGVVVGAAVLVGWAGRSLPIGNSWRPGRASAALAAGASLAVMAFGSSLGLTDEFADPETGRRFTGLHPLAALAGYFLLLFVVANWPLKRPRGALDPGK